MIHHYFVLIVAKKLIQYSQSVDIFGFCEEEEKNETDHPIADTFKRNNDINTNILQNGQIKHNDPKLIDKLALLDICHTQSANHQFSE